MVVWPKPSMLCKWEVKYPAGCIICVVEETDPTQGSNQVFRHGLGSTSVSQQEHVPFSPKGQLYSPTGHVFAHSLSDQVSLGERGLQL
ncbi:hypothetical protein Y1Q_0006101 [Alligator mississippiensis]|uniref:Uncharacterized protein n=1 Tax=Alligator mississippiensis TaxID=8496 RepID=A0A151N3Y0_ALLMI|nr:hypothetical protein Y1Q_0006101 [Alligator mississippiensis]